jgi:hypothetical protein
VGLTDYGSKERKMADSSRGERAGVAAMLAKALAFTLVFTVFHELLTASEAVFEHMKVGFLAWAVVGIPLWLLRKTTRPPAAALGLAIAVVPWYLALFWYVVPALIGGRLPGLALHVAWGLLATFAGGIAAELTERVAAPAVDYPRARSALIALVVVLLAAELLLGVAFSIEQPYIDVFEIP